jgi:hypothetical protein
LGEKFEHFREIRSLSAVVYVWQDRRQIEVRTRKADGEWSRETFVAGAVAPVPPLDCVLDVDALYARAGG